MPYGQSPWQDATAGAQGMGSSMTRIMQAQQIGRMKAQQFAAQLAVKQEQEQLNQQRINQEGQRVNQQGRETDARVPLLQAQTGEVNSVTAKNTQGTERQGQMDDLARAVANNVFKQRVPGGTPAVLRGDFTGQPGPTIANDQVLNQGDLVRNAMQLIAMHNPNELSTMMMGKNIPRGDVNYNPLTQEQVQGNPAAQPSGAPIDPTTGMTAYQSLALALQRSRMADQDKRTQAIFEKLHMSPEWQMEHPDGVGDEESNSGGQQQSQQSKQLDADTAKQFLKQAGGDKEKARALAKQQGYTF